MRKELQTALDEAIQLFEPGCVCVFEVASAVKDWLGEHNEPGLNDESAYAAMMRREKGGNLFTILVPTSRLQSTCL